MAEISKPSNLSLTWASGGDVLNPGDTKYATGWQVEIPPRQWFNYLDNRQDSAIAHINQHGVAAWDNITEYQAAKSYVQGVSTGAVYRCKVTHTDEDPELDVGEVYWEFAFASPGDFYTKVEADTAFLAKSANGSDILNTGTFRTNLSVYSKAETYTKVEVDTKTTVASTAQAQAQVSNITLITPQRLAEAFQGARQLLAPSGFQELPGGLLIQWGFAQLTATGVAQTFNYPKEFPTTPFVTIGSDGLGAIPSVEGFAIESLSATQFKAYRSTGTGTTGFYYIAIGN